MSSFERQGINIARQACDVCRSRKVRCDRAEPKCARCARLGQHCSYDVRSRPSRDELSNQLMKLHNRLAHTEARLTATQFHSSSVAGMPRIPTPMTIDTDSCFFETPSQLRLSPSISTHRHNEHQDSNITEVMDRDAQFAAFNFEDYCSTPTNQTEITEEPSASTIKWTGVPNISLELSSPGVHPVSSQYNLATSSGNTTQFAQSISTKDISNLHRKYFENIQSIMPILNEDRFLAEIESKSDSSTFASLSYAVALMGSTVSQESVILQQACYTLARQYAELSERDGSAENFACLNMFQALLLIVRYEIEKNHLPRAWITLGRAIRLSRLIGLHEIDYNTSKGNTHALRLALSPSEDFAVLEERRRSFWYLYIVESYLSPRTGMPFDLRDHQEWQICLPCPGGLRSDSVQDRMPFLGQIAKFRAEDYPQTSSFSAWILVAELCIRAMDHETSSAPISNLSHSFWDDHYSLLRTLKERSTILQAHLNARSVREDPLAFTVHTNLCAIEIILHETALRQMERQGLPELLAAESWKRSTAAALSIANTVRLIWPIRKSEGDALRLQAIFNAWPLVMAVTALRRDLSSPNSKTATASGVAHSVRLLLEVLDWAEEPGGYWHSQTVTAAATLHDWEENSGFDSISV